MSIYKGTEFIAGTPDLSEYAKSSDVNSSISSINNTLSSKANTDLSNVSSNIDYVVETYRSGTDWYRKYKSGWIEQGGIYNYGSLTRDWNAVTIKYPKPFADTNYTLTTQAGRNDGTTGSINNQSFVTRFTIGAFISEVYGDGNSQYLWWEAKGQGA